MSQLPKLPLWPFPTPPSHIQLVSRINDWMRRKTTSTLTHPSAPGGLISNHTSCCIGCFTYFYIKASKIPVKYLFLIRMWKNWGLDILSNLLKIKLFVGKLALGLNPQSLLLSLPVSLPGFSAGLMRRIRWDTGQLSDASTKVKREMLYAWFLKRLALCWRPC